MSRMVCFLCFAAVCGASDLRADEWHVYSDVRNGLTGNQQLTNAFARAQSGDTITIHKGVYNLATEEMMFRYQYEDGTTINSAGTCLHSDADNLTVQGDPETPESEIILSGMGEKTEGEGCHAIMRIVGNGCVVKNLTFYRGFADTKGAIYWNGKVMNTGDNNVFRRAGGLFMKGGLCSNCVFDSCYALQGAGLVGATEAMNCKFLRNNNNANNAGCATYETSIIRDSLFEDNARGAVRNCNGMISNCVFRINRHNGASGLFYYHTGSIIDCTFSNNTTVCIYLHGAKYMPKEIKGCRFEDNTCGDPFVETAGIGGSVPCTTPVSDCTFIGPNQINDFTAKISNCRFIRKSKSVNNHFLKNCPAVEDCEFTMETIADGVDLEGTVEIGVSVVSNCVLTRCHIHGINLYNGWVCLDVPAMTNCLVEGNSFWGYSNASYFGYTDGRDAEIVNCTVVTNNGAQGFYNAGTGIVTFRNTLFFNNKISGKAWGQRDISDTEGMGNETIRMVNSVYKSPVTFEGSHSSNMYGHWDWSPQFMKDRFPTRVHGHPYALSRYSPCLDAGTNVGWSESDIDLAGNKRLNGIVDIGCYENWHVAPGLKVVVR